MAKKPNQLKDREYGVIYARYSSSGQREESIEGQLRDCHAYAERNDIVIVGEYCDYALTGTNDRRPEFQRMIADSKKGGFSTVLVWKIDRFARSRYDSAIYKQKLRQNGVRVISAKESIPDGPEGIILEASIEGFAEYYSANLSQNVKRGLYDSALKRQTLGQSVFGLQKAPDGTWEHNPAEAPIVKRVFEEYVSGKSAKDIMVDLNNEGYRTNKGNVFNKNSIRRILQNTKYYGLYQYSDIYDENGIPPIVSKALFDEAQRMLERHHEKPAEKKIDGGFLLTGKLFCGKCGKPMTGDSGTSKSGAVHQYYTCVGRRKDKTCDKERAQKDWIEDIIVKKLMEIACNDEIIEAFADQYMKWQDKQVSPVAGLEDRLAVINKAIDNNLKLVDSGLVSESVVRHISELETEKAEIEKSISAEKLKTPHLKYSEVVYFLRQFRDGDTEDTAWRIYLIDTFLKAAYLYDDGRLTLHLNFSSEKGKVTLKLSEKAIAEGEPLCSTFAPLAPPNVKRRIYVVWRYFLFLNSIK